MEIKFFIITCYFWSLCAICFYFIYAMGTHKKKKLLKQKEALLREAKALKEKINILSNILDDINRINRELINK